MAKHYHTHPPAPPPPAPAPAKPAESVLDFALKLVGVAVLMVGVVTLLGPWLHSTDRGVAEARRRGLPPGWVCWEMSTSGGSHRGCEPARGWHIEIWPGAGEVSVPDRAAGRGYFNDYYRRRYVIDDYQ